jgi:hypothetical protein
MGFCRQGQRALQGHVSVQRCSGLDLNGCDPGPGYAARDVTQGAFAVAYRSSATGWRPRCATEDVVACGISGTPPACAPARVIPGRTLLEGEGRVGSRSSPQLQCTSLLLLQPVWAVPVPEPALIRAVLTAMRWGLPTRGGEGRIDRFGSPDPALDPAPRRCVHRGERHPAT